MFHFPGVEVVGLSLSDESVLKSGRKNLSALDTFAKKSRRGNGRPLDHKFVSKRNLLSW